jgi:hypothetical protein
MDFVFDQIRRLRNDETPAHIKRALIDWFRRNPSHIALLASLPLEEVPGAITQQSALNGTWMFRNRINQQRLLINSIVGAFTVRDLQVLQLRCVDEKVMLAIAISTSFDDEVLKRLSRSNEEERYAIAALQVSVTAIGDRAFAPHLTEAIMPKRLVEAGVVKRTRFPVLQLGRSYGDGRTLRRAFWQHVQRTFNGWDRCAEDATKWQRYRVLNQAGVTIGQRVAFGELVVWPSWDDTPEGQHARRLLMTSKDLLTSMLSCKLEPGYLPFFKSYAGPLHAEADLEAAAKWLRTEVDRYELAINEILGKQI